MQHNIGQSSQRFKQNSIQINCVQLKKLEWQAHRLPHQHANGVLYLYAQHSTIILLRATRLLKKQSRIGNSCLRVSTPTQQTSQVKLIRTWRSTTAGRSPTKNRGTRDPSLEVDRDVFSPISVKTPSSWPLMTPRTPWKWCSGIVPILVASWRVNTPRRALSKLFPWPLDAAVTVHWVMETVPISSGARGNPNEHHKFAQSSKIHPVPH